MKKHYIRIVAIALVLATLVFPVHAADKTKIVFVAGRQSHGWGSHEHKAGSMLLADRLNKNMPNVNAVVMTGGWPEDNRIFEVEPTITSAALKRSPRIHGPASPASSVSIIEP